MRRNRSQWSPFAFVLAAAACSSSKEWEPLAGSLALYAEPLSPVAGQPLVLGVDARNVGPIDVYQGPQRIASLANPSFGEGRLEVQVLARSTELPRAVTTAYDYERLEVEARAFPSAPRPIDVPDAAAPDPEQESCPGVVDLAAVECSNAADGASIAVRLRNELAGPVSVYELPPGVIDPNQCDSVLVALLGAGASRDLTRPGGTVLRFVDDRSNATLRLLRLPSAAATCTLIVPAR